MNKQITQVCTASNPMNRPTPLADQLAAALERMRQADERQQQLTTELLERTRELLAALED